MHKGVIASLILSVLLVVFALNNSAPVTINLWWITKVEISLALLVIVMLVAGVLIGYLLLVPSVFRKNKTIRNKDSEIKKLKAQIAQEPTTQQKEPTKNTDQ